MSTTSVTDTNTTELDNKKGTGSASISKTLMSFLKTVTGLLLFIILYFAISGYLLYIVKVAAADILPKNDTYYPFNLSATENNNMATTVNAFYEKMPSLSPQTGPPIIKSMRMLFNNVKAPAGENFLLKYFILKQEDVIKKHFLIVYFYSIVSNIIKFNYKLMDMFFGIFYSKSNAMGGFMENLFLLFGPIITSLFVFLIMPVVNFIYFCYSWFANMSVFFKHKDGSDINILSPVDYAVAWAFVFVFFILFWIIMGPAMVLYMPLMIFCLVSVVSYTYIYENSTTSPSSTSSTSTTSSTKTLMNFIKDVFKYYKNTILLIICVGVILSTLSTFGGIYALVVLIFVILMYNQKILGNVFKQNIPNVNELFDVKNMEKMSQSGGSKIVHSNYANTNLNLNLKFLKKLNATLTK